MLFIKALNIFFSSFQIRLLVNFMLGLICSINPYLQQFNYSFGRATQYMRNLKYLFNPLNRNKLTKNELINSKIDFW
jgi:hypothetical protein